MIQGEGEVDVAQVGHNLGRDHIFRSSMFFIQIIIADVLGHRHAVALGQIELDQAVCTALAAVHVVDGQGVIALSGKAGAGGAKSPVQIGLAQGTTQTVAFRHIFIGGLVANLTIRGRQYDIASGEVDAAGDCIVSSSDIQCQNPINVDPHIIVACKLKSNILAIGIFTGIGHLEIHSGDHTKTIFNVFVLTSLAVRIVGLIDRICFCGASKSRCGIGIPRGGAQAIEGSKSGNLLILISGITGISGRQIGNLHFGVGSAGTIFKVHAVLVAVQFVISGFLIIDERHLYIRIYIGIVVVLTGKQVCRIHVIAERSVAALAELAGRQAGINIVVLRLFAV